MDIKNPMLGAIIGDIVGSRYEYSEIEFDPDFELFTNECHITDDTVMTLAIYKALSQFDNLENVDFDEVKAKCAIEMLNFGWNYPNAGYGQSFIKWLFLDPKPYNSFGNGSAMRVSSAGYFATSLDMAEKLGEVTALPTHNHPEGVKGAKIIAGCIFHAINGSDKLTIKDYASQYYDLYIETDVSGIFCQNTVPEAINIFLNTNSFEECLRECILWGYDTDTRAAIACSIAGAYYGVPDSMIDTVKERYLPDDLANITTSIIDRVIC